MREAKTFQQAEEEEQRQIDVNEECVEEYCTGPGQLQARDAGRLCHGVQR